MAVSRKKEQDRRESIYNVEKGVTSMRCRYCGKKTVEFWEEYDLYVCVECEMKW